MGLALERTGSDCGYEDQTANLESWQTARTLMKETRVDLGELFRPTKTLCLADIEPEGIGRVVT